MNNARKFVFDYWFDLDKPSKWGTEILGWIKGDKLTLEGKRQYKVLCKNVNKFYN